MYVCVCTLVSVVVCMSVAQCKLPYACVYVRVHWSKLVCVRIAQCNLGIGLCVCVCTLVLAGVFVRITQYNLDACMFVSACFSP